MAAADQRAKSDGSVHIPVLDESQLRDLVAQTDALRIDGEAMTPCQQGLALCLYRTQTEQLRLGQIKTADGIEHTLLTGNAHQTLSVLLQRTFPALPMLASSECDVARSVDDWVPPLPDATVAFSPAGS